MNDKTIRLEIHIFQHTEATTSQPKRKKRQVTHKRGRRCAKCGTLYKRRGWLKQHEQHCKGVRA